ncbi:MAG TPA: TetR/AcrR family transcriptional regulator [Acidimicrobiales bacterium]|nr:TetR/AcrR family transcriptional regulator [Acidimicrobiales bacterium]
MTREAIVAIALEAVRSSGARGLALREVARALGVSLPTVQRHFATREDLWRACVDAALAEVSSDLSPRLSPGELSPGELRPAGLRPAEPSTEELLRAQVKRSVTRPRFTAAMTQGGGLDGTAYLLDQAKPLVGQGRALVQQAIDTGALRAVDPSALVALVGLGIGSLASSREGLRRLHDLDLDDPAQAERFVDSLVDILLYGLLPRS